MNKLVHQIYAKAAEYPQIVTPTKYCYLYSIIFGDVSTINQKLMKMGSLKIHDTVVSRV